MSDRILRDNDGDEDRGLSPPTRLQGSLVESQLTAADEDENFEVVDTDADLKPLAIGGAASESDEERDDKQATEPTQPSQDPEDGKRRRDRAEERRRRREGRQRTFAENAELKAEVAHLRQQIEGIAPRLSQIDQQRIQDQITATDRDIQAAAQAAVVARRKVADAIATADTDTIAAALEERDAAVDRGKELAAYKTRLSAAIPEVDQRQRQPVRQQPTVQPLPAAAVEFAKDFRETHNWMRQGQDGSPLDLDTDIMLRIDNAVMNEGYDPRTSDYWDEIEERARQYLPHRFAANTQRTTAAPRQQTTQQPARNETRRGPMTSGASDRAARPSSDNRVYLSPERKEALIDSGALDRTGKNVLDRDKYSRIMRAYQKYDRDNGITG